MMAGNTATLWATPNKVDSVEDCYFYHSMDVPGYGFQKGNWDLRGRFEQYIGNVDIKGKRVLDIGTASGFLTFSAEQAGAAEVVSIDINCGEDKEALPFCGSQYVEDRKAWNAMQTKSLRRLNNSYWLSHQAFKSNALMYYGSVYSLPGELDRFDVAFLGSILEHLFNPFAALDRVGRLVDDLIVINTSVIPVLDTEQPLAYFTGNAQRPEINYVFWLYSIGTLRNMLKIIGFDVINIVSGSYLFVDQNRESERKTIIAKRTINR